MNQAERRAIMERIYASLTERGYRPVWRCLSTQGGKCVILGIIEIASGT